MSQNTSKVFAEYSVLSVIQLNNFFATYLPYRNSVYSAYPRRLY